MKNLKRFMFLALAIIVMGSMASCKHQGFKKDKSGFYYKFYEQNDTAAQPDLGDVVYGVFTMRTLDSTLIENAPLELEIGESLYEGDLYAALQIMHVGDSATFILNADSMFHYYFGREYDGANSKDRDLYFDVKLTSLMPKAEKEALQEQQRREYQHWMDSLKNVEDSLLTAYVVNNKIKVKPTATGLYIVHTQVGKGAPAEAGKMVSVHYEGRLLNGQVFDSSIQRGEPIEFVLGQGQVIPGWEEGIATLREGGKATFIIPSEQAYGAQGAYPVIFPYTPLVFDVELLSVKDAPAPTMPQ